MELLCCLPDRGYRRADRGARREIEAQSHRRKLAVTSEIKRLKDDYDSRTFTDRFHTLCMDCIKEIYGPLTPRDFNSHSAMIGFVACKKNLIYELICERTIDNLCSAT